MPLTTIAQLDRAIASQRYFMDAVGGGTRAGYLAHYSSGDPRYANEYFQQDHNRLMDLLGQRAALTISVNRPRFCSRPLGVDDEGNPDRCGGLAGDIIHWNTGSYNYHEFES